MIKIGLYCEPINADSKGYLGLYRGSFSIGYMENNNRLYNLINDFLERTADGQSLDYNEKNRKKIVELYRGLKNENCDVNLVCFTDDKQVEIPDFMLIGYDICADSMYYSPIGDGFLMQYNRYTEFYADMSFEMYSLYIENINEKWLFNSHEIAMDFAKYCNHINKKNYYCIESENDWRPVAIYLYRGL